MASPWTDLVAISLAFILGAAIGAEREYRRHPGGLRSLALVSVAACTFARVIVTVGGNNLAAGIGALATGIGFLGAGVILHQGPQVRGLSTAASFWAAARDGNGHRRRVDGTRPFARRADTDRACRAALDFRLDREERSAGGPGPALTPQGRFAMQSNSTSAPRASAVTPTQLRTGRSPSGNSRAYDAFIAA